MSRKQENPRRRYVRFTRWRRAHFFRVLEETGSAAMAVEAAGVSDGCIYRLRRVEPGFADRMDAARETADARLRAQDRDEARAAGARGEDCPPASAAAPGEGGLVVRRGIGGRLRVMASGNHWWTERDDAVFLGHLRSTGNVRASARATGFTPKAARDRRKRNPAFADAWEAALDEAERRLEERVLAAALNGHAAMAPGAFEVEEPERYDPWLALALLKHLERRRRRRAVRPPAVSRRR